MFFMPLGLTIAVAMAVAILADSSCVAPGTCQPPPSLYTSGRDVVPRKQWGDNGGYCGALSIQAIALSYGAYISQDLIRKAAPPGGGHGNPENGYEILHTNIEAALDKLGFTYESWDWEYAPTPQGPNYLPWLKQQLLQNSAVVQFVICKGDAHNSYGPPDAPIVYDHIEPFFRLYTNHSLEDSSVHADDVVNHGSDYSPDGDKNLGYFRAFSTLLDGTAMETNCRDAQAGYGKNEMYPCIYYDTVYGYSITGLEQDSSSSIQLMPLVLYVNSTSEPDIIEGDAPAAFQGHIVVNNLRNGTDYIIYRWDDIYSYPKDPSTFSDSPYSYKYSFTATNEEYEIYDDNLFLSNTSVVYACVEEQP